MRNVPILDEAYMQRRAQWEAMKHQLEVMSIMYDGYKPARDEKDKAREEYLADKITLEAFEARLDAALGLKPR